MGGGFALLAACLLPGQATGGKVFIPLWLLGAFVNMWVDTTHGFSWAEEFPISSRVCAVPVASAALVRWKFG